MNATLAQRSLYFIDATLPDLATLLAGLPRDAEAHLLPAGRDGLQVIADTLYGRNGIAALHLITHGAPGKLFIGNVELDREILRNSHVEMEAISNAMDEDGELLIYGCEVAAGREGRQFIGALSEMTGLTVAAATHKVGAAELGGDWSLDVVPQTMKTKSLTVSEWQGVLIPTNVTSRFTLDLSSAQQWYRPIPENFQTDVNLDPIGDAVAGLFGIAAAQLDDYTPIYDVGIDQGGEYGALDLFNYAWVKFSPAVTGEYSIKITGVTGDIDPMLFLYSGNQFPVDLATKMPNGDFAYGDDDSFDELFGANDGVNEFFSGMTNMSLAGGGTYYLLVSGYNVTDAGKVSFEIEGPGAAQPLAGTLTVLDLDQLGTGNEVNINSTGVFDWDIPVYFADSATVLGTEAPADYKTLTISFDSTDWTEGYAFLGLAAMPVASIDDDEYSSIGLSDGSYANDPDIGYSNTIGALDWGGTVGLQYTIKGEWGQAVTITFKKDGVGNLGKNDMNLLLRNLFFAETDSRFSETRAFSLKATAADDTETAASTFSVSFTPDTTGPSFGFVDYPDDGATALPVDFFTDSSISFSFDEDVTPVAGKYLKLWKVVADGDDELVESVQVTNEDAIQVDADTIDYTPQVESLANGTRYYITIDAGAFVDGSNNPSSAYDGSSDWSFSTIAEALGTWTFVDTDPSTPDAVDPLSASAYRGNLEVTANGKYVLVAQEGSYKASIDYPVGLTVMQVNQDDSWAAVGEARFASAGSTGLYDLVIGSNGATDTLYTISASDGYTNNTTINNSIRVHTFDGTNWLQVGGNVADTIGRTSGNPANIQHAPKGVLVGNTLYVAYSYLDIGNAKIAVKSIDLTAQNGNWQLVGAAFDAPNSTEAFDLAVYDGSPVLGIVGNGNDPTLQLYKLGQAGWESAATPVTLPGGGGGLGFNFSWGNASTLKLAQDGNCVLYAAYGYNDSSANKTGVSKIDLAQATPSWTHLANPVDSSKSLNMGNGLDLAFDSQNRPYLTLIDQNGIGNVYRWDAAESSWRELDTGSSLDNVGMGRFDLEISGDELSLLMSAYGQIQLAQFEPSQAGGGGGGSSDTTPPAYQSASIDGTTLTLAYDEALKADGLPEASDFTLKVNGTAVTNGIFSVEINSDNQKLDLTLANPVFFGQKVTISYNDPTTGNDANAIQDTAGNDAASFTDYGVANSTAATSSVNINSQVWGKSVSLSVGGDFSINPPAGATAPTNSPAPSNLGKSIKMPLGQFSFDIAGLPIDQNNPTVGAKAQLSMTADADLKQLTYYKWNYVNSKYDNIAKSVSINTQTNKATVFFELTDGGAYDADRTVNGTIQDPGGVAENKLLPVILENETVIGDVRTLNTDQVNGVQSYAITGGADADKFNLNASGALSFKVAPNYESPNDVGDTPNNNTYAVTVTVTGSNGGSEIQPLIVNVMNVPEAGDPTVGSNVSGEAATVTVNAPPPTPTPEPEPTPTPVPDTDGVPDAIENATPGLPPANGGAPVAGDGNGDGVADSQQSGVTSVGFKETTTAASNPGSAPTAFVSLVVDSLAGKIDTTDTNTATLTNVRQLDAPANLPDVFKMPLGLIAFSASVGLNTGSPGGVTETFSLYLDPSLGANGYWLQNTDGVWVNLASAPYGGEVVSEGGRTRLDFQLTDGGEFDADGQVNGVMTITGAAGTMPLSLVGFKAEPVAGAEFWF